MDKAAHQLESYRANNNSNNGGTLKTSMGAPVDSLTASMTVGDKGPIVLQDFTLIDHLAHFDRERIPERVVHAKGSGALGTFTVTHDISHICKAHVFSRVHQTTKVCVRFSTVGGESGSSDVARDPRGFAIKFYTEEGNWDIVGNNTPIFFIRDPILFPSFIHTQKRNPATHLPDPTAVWDFMSQRPESIHQFSFLFSNRGLPNGYRHMNGYGSHTFVNTNARGDVTYVKYHFKTNQGISNLPPNHTITDADYATRDLYNAIATKNFPSWTMYIQTMTPTQAKECSFDPFDLTKVWSHKDYPLQPVGIFQLNENPTDYFAQVEQVAFSPSHLVPGIEPSQDKMLQARLFSYPDTHRHRLGANYAQLPINQPIHHGKTNNYQRDGPATYVVPNGSPNYFPNSFHGPQPDVSKGQWHIPTYENASIKRVDTGYTEDNFSQCRDFYLNVLNEEERYQLTHNIAQHMSGVADPRIVQRALAHFASVTPDYAQRISNHLKRIPKQTSPRYPVAKLSPPRDIPTKCPYALSSKL